MRTRWPALILLLGLCALGSCASPTQGSGTGEPAGELLTLRFYWPRDLTAEVEMKRVVVREDGRAKPSRVIEARYRLRVEPQPDSLRIVSDALRLTAVDGRPVSEGPLDGVEGAEAAAGIAPTIRVDEEGEVLEVEGLEELRRLTAEQIAKASPGTAAQSERIAQMAITPERLSEHWAAAVGSWVGTEVEVAAAYDMELDDQPATLEVSERTACFPGDAGTRCVRLLLKSRADVDLDAPEFRSVAREFMAQLGAPELPADALVAVTQREEVELLTEPERLIPHFVRTRTEKRIEAELAGERRTVSRTDETEHRYRY